MVMSQPKKQFISGAVCPACNEVDKIQMWYVDGQPHRECAACGYADKLDADGQSIPTASGSGEAAGEVVEPALLIVTTRSQ
jgi:hypothetical protein